MDFTVVERILWDNKDKIPQGDYIELCEEIQKAHNADAEVGGILHTLEINYMVGIQVINLTETELITDMDGEDEEDWDNHMQADKPIDMEPIAETAETLIMLKEEIFWHDSDRDLYETQDILKDLLHKSNINSLWLYMHLPNQTEHHGGEDYTPIDRLYKRLSDRVKVLEQNKELGLQLYRVLPLKITVGRLQQLHPDQVGRFL